MFVKYNPNPTGRNVEDCAVRAVAKALDVDWEKSFALLTRNAYEMGDMPHSNSVIGSVLRQHKFYRQAIPDFCPDCYTAEEFALDHPTGTFVLFFTNHVATIKDGNLYDSFNSSEEIPSYFWYRKDEK